MTVNVGKGCAYNTRHKHLMTEMGTTLLRFSRNHLKILVNKQTSLASLCNIH